MTFKEIAYKKIIEGERVASYRLYDQFWYVVQWNEKVYIHYRVTTKKRSIIFSYYICDSKLSPKWPAQYQDVIIH